jgi:hypothetical protein
MDCLQNTALIGKHDYSEFEKFDVCLPTTRPEECRTHARSSADGMYHDSTVSIMLKCVSNSVCVSRHESVAAFRQE